MKCLFAMIDAFYKDSFLYRVGKKYKLNKGIRVDVHCNFYNITIKENQLNSNIIIHILFYLLLHTYNIH